MSAAILLLAAAASAGAPEPLPEGLISDLRLRYEHVDQAGIAETSEALTLRARLGFETPRVNGFALLAEGEVVERLAGAYNDAVPPAEPRPVIADPDVAELNRLQLSYTGANEAGFTLGRQFLALDDQRFVGPVGFRQNSQTFDALRLDSGAALPAALTYAYIDRVHRIFGYDHPAGEFDSDSHVLEARIDTAIGELAGYALLLDLENAPALSSQTIGARLAGSSGAWSYRLEFARQSEHANAPRAFDLDYGRAEAAYDAGFARFGAGVERLEGDGTQGFATPLATLHKFNGAADAFVATPAEGLRDLWLSARWTVLEDGERPVSLAITGHDFASDDGAQDFGGEIDLSVGLPLTAGVRAEAKAAVFNGGEAGPADRTKLWFTLSWTL